MFLLSDCVFHIFKQGAVLRAGRREQEEEEEEEKKQQKRRRTVEKHSVMVGGEVGPDSQYCPLHKIKKLSRLQFVFLRKYSFSVL